MKSSSKPKRLQWLWPALEAIPGTAAVRTDWRERLGTEFESNLFLQQQTWPRSQTRLLLIDTSQSDTFSRMIRHWRAECDYSQVQSVALTVGGIGGRGPPRP